MINKSAQIPTQVLKEILELIEFMSRDKNGGLNLEISSLADLSIRCVSLPKAIYFKER